MKLTSLSTGQFYRILVEGNLPKKETIIFTFTFNICEKVTTPREMLLADFISQEKEHLKNMQSLE